MTREKIWKDRFEREERARKEEERARKEREMWNRHYQKKSNCGYSMSIFVAIGR